MLKRQVTVFKITGPEKLKVYVSVQAKIYSISQKFLYFIVFLCDNTEEITLCYNVK